MYLGGGCTGQGAGGEDKRVPHDGGDEFSLEGLWKSMQKREDEESRDGWVPSNDRAPKALRKAASQVTLQVSHEHRRAELVSLLNRLFWSFELQSYLRYLLAQARSLYDQAYSEHHAQFITELGESCYRLSVDSRLG